MGELGPTIALDNSNRLCSYQPLTNRWQPMAAYHLGLQLDPTQSGPSLLQTVNGRF